MDNNCIQASQAQLAVQYRNVKLKLLNTIHNIKFNKKCIKHDIKPNYVNIKINNKSQAAQRTKIKAEKLWVKNEIKFLYHKKTLLNSLAYRKYLELANASHPAQLESILDSINTSSSRIIRNKKVTLRKKLNLLINRQTTKENVLLFDFPFYPRTTNCTDIIFNDNEMAILDKGLNYNLPRSGRKGYFNELINAECAVKAIPDEDVRNFARHVISKKVNNKFKNKSSSSNLSQKQKNEYRSLNSIKEKLELNDAMLCKADKGNTIVVLYKKDYLHKVNSFIDNNNISKLNKDPTCLYQRRIKKLINNSKVLLSDDTIKRLKIMNPQAPTLRGLPKIHKEGVPIRPLVNYMSAPTYKIAKHLEFLLKTHITLENNYSLKNSYELIDSIRNFEIKSHHTLASFDIVNLYTNVPVKETLEIVFELLETSNLLPEAVKEFMNLLTEVLKQNYFRFDDKFYNQADGLAMGSPLSGILANIYLNHIENKFIMTNKNKHADKILFYRRYVDDTIIIYNGNSRQLNILHNYLNKLAPNLKFTLEIEEQSTLNFLDLTLDKSSNKFQFAIYRKPTTTSQTIHANSYHPHSQKMGAYNSMVHRLLNVPLNEDQYNKEINIIKQIAMNNGYKSNMVDRLISKHRNKLSNNSNLLESIDGTNNERIKYTSVEYSHTLQHGLNKVLKEHNIKLAFRTSNRVRNIIKVKNDNIDKYDQTGIYKLKCAECPNVYVGQTGRAFSTRFKEHCPNPKLDKQKSTFGQHLIDYNHSTANINDSLEILHVCSKGKKMDTLEEFEIYKLFKNNSPDEVIINDKLLFSSHSIFNSLLSYNNRHQLHLALTDKHDTPGQETALQSVYYHRRDVFVF